VGGELFGAVVGPLVSPVFGIAYGRFDSPHTLGPTAALAIAQLTNVPADDMAEALLYAAGLTREDASCEQ
jgi:hypothetical protein